MKLYTLFFGLQCLFNSPCMHGNAKPLLQPTLVPDDKLQIALINEEDLNSFLDHRMAVNHRLLAYASVRINFTEEKEKFVPMIGKAKLCRSSDLVLLVTESDSNVYFRVVRIDKNCYKMVK